MQTTRAHKIERLVGPSPERVTLSLFIRAASRHGKWTWFRPDAVPPFDGDHAWFECEKVRGGWRPLRQVAKPAWVK